MEGRHRKRVKAGPRHGSQLRFFGRGGRTGDGGGGCSVLWGRSGWDGLWAPGIRDARYDSIGRRTFISGSIKVISTKIAPADR
jgi:hypothetical protein